MTRTCTGLIIVAAGLALGGCQNKWMNSWTDRSGEPQEAVRFDANGNKIYDPSIRDNGRTWDASRNQWNNTTSPSDRRAWDNNQNTNPNNQSTTQNNWQNRTKNDSGYTQDDRRADRSEQETWKKWNDRDMTAMRSTELPQPVMSTFQRQAPGAELMETGWATHDGRTCYCTKARKDGVTWKMISDADGNLLAVKRLD